MMLTRTGLTRTRTRPSRTRTRTRTGHARTRTRTRPKRTRTRTRTRHAMTYKDLQITFTHNWSNWMYDVKNNHNHNICDIKSQSPRTEMVTYAIKINFESKSQ